MSIVTPWRREEPSRKEKEGLGPGRDQPPRFRRTGLLVVAFLLLGVTLSAWYLWTQGYFHSVKMTDLAFIPGDTILDIHGDVSLIKRGGHIFIGRLAQPTDWTSLGLEVSHALVIDDGPQPMVALLSGKSVYAVESAGARTVAVLGENQRFLPMRGHSLFLIIEPKPRLAYGANWAIQALGPNGKVSWQTSIPSIPFFATSDGSHIALAAIDVSETQVCHLFLLSTLDGSIKAQRSLGQGHWRDIYITSDRVIAVLDRGISVLGKSGEILWEFTSKAPIVTCCLVSDGLIVASGFEKNPVSISAGSKSTVTCLTLDGRLIWERNLTTYVEGLTAAGRTILAYNKDRVIGFSYNTGKVEFSLRPRYPLERASGGVLAVKKDGGYLFWKLEEGQEAP